MGKKSKMNPYYLQARCNPYLDSPFSLLFSIKGSIKDRIFFIFSCVKFQVGDFYCLSYAKKRTTLQFVREILIIPKTAITGSQSAAIRLSKSSQIIVNFQIGKRFSILIWKGAF